MNINPGQGTVLTAVPLDASGSPTKLPVGDVPLWAVDRAADVVVSPSADGLTLTVAVNPSAAPGDINFAITDGVIATAKGSFVLTVPPAAGPNPVASFGVTASVPA